MITRIVKAKLKPDDQELFLKYIKSFIVKAKDFKNNYHADCFADMDEKNQYHIYTIWKSEGALNKFRKSDINIEFKNKLNDWCEIPFSAWTVENII